MRHETGTLPGGRLICPVVPSFVAAKVLAMGAGTCAANDHLTLLGKVSCEWGYKTPGKKVGHEFGLTDAAPNDAAGAGCHGKENFGTLHQYHKTQSGNGTVALSIDYHFGSYGE